MVRVGFEYYAMPAVMFTRGRQHENCARPMGISNDQHFEGKTANTNEVILGGRAGRYKFAGGW